MSRKIVLVALLSLFLLTNPSFVQPAIAADDSKQSQNETKVEFKKIDKRAEILSAYLSQFDSPLQNFSQDLVDASEKYEIDWKLVPAISGVESTFGKFIPGGYNGWGWGVYNDQAIYFSSWKEAIYAVAKGLKENYIDKGLKDPYSMNKVYAASTSWGTRVDYYLKDIEKFEQEYTVSHPETSKIETSTQIAATSGQLANR